MTEWIDCTLGDVLTLQRGFDLPLQERKAGTFPIIASTGPVGVHHEAQVTAPGVVIGRSGSIGGGQFITTDFWPLNTTLWVKDFKGNHPRFCYYLLRGIDFSSFNVGSGVPTLNRNHVHPLPVTIPQPHEQAQIAGLLGAIDDKIELNRRMNETLEAMAQAIFRDWFVDFGPVRRKLEGATDPVAIMGGLMPDPARAAEMAGLFPDGFSEDELPTGWRLGDFGDMAITAGETVDPTRLGEDTPYIGLEHMPRRSITLDCWDFAGKVSSQKSRFSNGQVLFGKLRPYFHKVGIAPVDGVCSTDIVVLDSRAEFDRELVACCASSDAFVAFTDLTSSGTKMPRTSWSHMKTYELAIADAPVRQAFSRLVRPMHQKVVSSVAECRSLAETRDYLLPRLMSGEVRVGDVQSEAAA